MRSLTFGFAASLRRVRLFLLTVTAASAFLVTSALAADTDNDGIPDEWERSGHGPLNPRIHDVRVGRQDVVLVVSRRPGLRWATIEPALNRVREFYRNVPTRNPDGSTGINIVIVQGPELPASDAETEYGATYPRAFPAAWRGIGHGYLVENGAGGGGQTASPEFSASGYSWHTIAHELGHQLQLDHLPPDSGVSPLFPSIMSYAYSYNFGGDANAVRFSDGAFASTVLNENSLNETLPFPLARVRFLENEFGFRLRAAGASSTQVDWDRDGVFGETNISADINDAYAVGVQMPFVDAGPASGAPSMVQIGSQLHLVYPALTGAPTGWSAARAGGFLTLQTHSGGSSFSAPRRLVARRLTSDPSAAAFGNRLAVAYVSGARAGGAGLPFVTLFNTTASGVGEGGAEALDLDQMVNQAVLAGGLVQGASQNVPLQNTPTIPGVASPTTRLTAPSMDRLWMFTWNESTRAIRVTEVTDRAAAGAARPLPHIERGASYEIMNGSTALRSDNEIGAAYDTLTGKMILVTYETHWDQPNKIRVNTLRRNAEGRWVYESHRYVGNETTGAWGNNASSIVLNPRQPIDGHSQMNIYIRGGAADDALSTHYLLREIADRTQHDGWRIKMMIDDWNQSLSPPAGALFNGTQAFAFRLPNTDPRAPSGIIFYRQTGVVTGPLRDMNEVAFLQSTGIRRALERMREYHGIAAP
jgi:hypothetical protein